MPGHTEFYDEDSYAHSNVSCFSAPWLLRDEKTNLEGSLADIYWYSS